LRPPYEGQDLDEREAFGHIRRLEFAPVLELDARQERRDVGSPHACELLVTRKPSVPGHDPPHRVGLRVHDAGRQPQAADGQSVGGCGLNHVRARPPGRVRVVEDDAGGAPFDGSTKRGQKAPQRASGLVAVQPDIALRDQRPGQRALAGGRQSHDDHDISSALLDRGGYRLRRRSSTPGSRWKGHIERGAIGVREHDAAGAGDRFHGLDPRGPWDRHDQVREIHQPCQRNLGRGGVMSGRDCDERRVRGRLAAP
jgi:hypothetical protein